MRSLDTANRNTSAHTEDGRPVIGDVNKVLSQSFVDGPGNRAVVFLQGCNFNCLYCHNPYMISLCNHCGLCVDHCPQDALTVSHGRVSWDVNACVRCDRCIEVCPSSSSPQVHQQTAEELWQEIEPFTPFLSGITMSGGEATLQTPFVRAFFSEVKAKSNLNTLIQTNGDVSRNELAALLPVTDYFMVDLKAFDSTTHQELTGNMNTRVMDTIRLLANHKKLFQVRQVVVPGFNDSEAEATNMAQFLLTVDPHISLRFLLFRPHGARGDAATWDAPGDEIMGHLVAAANAAGLKHVDRSI